MFDNAVPQSDVALRILNAADTLMASGGVQHLSTHKIAKAAGVSVGTIYLYFKDKEDLLNQLVYYIFARYHHYVEAQYDEELPLFEQYQQLWRLQWGFMLAHPTMACNVHQYEALPEFQRILDECIANDILAWSRFEQRGKAQGAIVDLPSKVLYTISIGTAWGLMYEQVLSQTHFPESILEQVIVRTWKAISI
ncbi:AcrR family transcriptional regulator [Pasteurellaceae bacterium Macca]|nr:AcrR family transcriptional regulator [Pasteurellaceae bacterium Macca]